MRALDMDRSGKKERQALLLPGEVAKGRSGAACGSDSIWQLRPSARHPSLVSERPRSPTDCGQEKRILIHYSYRQTFLRLIPSYYP
ncbi:hypothetical protein AVEN_42040-1 [Araneus ventricosus]|uniref:Uncharacterized protein n=1 Tax=Araneus ventricosus TaxID=182803 RepID=A0A4Y2GGX0_ARAVE|nr:hypothetical protein AVEN_42040-1 [Araneus ventricosus]